jgi:hypothetical protein
MKAILQRKYLTKWFVLNKVYNFKISAENNFRDYF